MVARQRKIAFVDQGMRIHIADVDSGKATKIDESPEWMNHGGLQAFGFEWSADSRWLTYSRPTGDANNSMFLYDTKGAKLTRVTTGYLNDSSRRSIRTANTCITPRTASSRRSTAASTTAGPIPTRPGWSRCRCAGRPVAAPRAQRLRRPSRKRRSPRRRRTKPQSPPADAKDVNIDLDGFEGARRRAAAAGGKLLRPAGRKGKLLFQRLPRSGSGDTKSPIVYFDLNEREEKPVLEDAGGFEVTADGKKMLVAFQGRFAILEIKSPQKFEKPIATADMEAPVDPRAEWKQMFEDVYRFQRDYFYDRACTASIGRR